MLQRSLHSAGTRPAPTPAQDVDNDGAIGLTWVALHDAADVVCAFAGLTPEVRHKAIRDFPAIMRAAGHIRHDQTHQGIEDLAAIMEAGIAALRAVRARGVPVNIAASALWREFLSARAALLALAPPRCLRRIA